MKHSHGYKFTVQSFSLLKPSAESWKKLQFNTDKATLESYSKILLMILLNVPACDE